MPNPLAYLIQPKPIRIVSNAIPKFNNIAVESTFIERIYRLDLKIAAYLQREMYRKNGYYSVWNSIESMKDILF